MHPNITIVLARLEQWRKEFQEAASNTCTARDKHWLENQATMFADCITRLKHISLEPTPASFSQVECEAIVRALRRVAYPYATRRQMKATASAAAKLGAPL